MKLYEIHEAIDSLVDETGEIDETKLEALEKLELERERVILWIGAKADELKKEHEAVYSTMRTFRVRAEVLGNAADRLKQYIHDHMSPGEKIDSDPTLPVVRAQRNGGALPVNVTGIVPEKFLAEVERPPDLKRICQYLQDDELKAEVEKFAELGERGYHIRVGK